MGRLGLRLVLVAGAVALVGAGIVAGPLVAPGAVVAPSANAATATTTKAPAKKKKSRKRPSTVLATPTSKPVAAPVVNPASPPPDTAAPAPTPATTTPAPAASACGGEVPARASGVWTCTWSDEFTGTALSDTWSVIPYGLGSSCLFDDPSYVTVSGGMLALSARKLPSSDYCVKQWGLKYGGGGIQSKDGFSQRFGRFEIRAKLPAGNGFWPAFWLLPDDDSYAGEIDVLESYGGRGSVGDATLHAPAGGPGPQRTCTIKPDYATAFHTYAVEWEPGSIRVLYDGTVCANFTGMSDAGTGSFPSSFAKPYHVLLNLAVQPWWPPDASTPFPSTMQVDYVRAWK